MLAFADLHTHTTCSDGSLSPAQLIALAAERGLQALAITDHDTTAALPEAEEVAYQHNIFLVPGIELSCTAEGKDYHILGYFINPTCNLLRLHQEYCLEQRIQRIYTSVAILQELGLQLSAEEVLEFAGSAAPGRMHLANVLVEKEYCRSAGEAFNRFLGDGRPAHVEKWHFPPEQGIDLIHQCGGVAVLAHPGKHTPTKALTSMIVAGLDGIETRHPSHSTYLVRTYARIAREHGLLASGGSDFHGNRPYDDANFGTLRIPFDEVELLQNKAAMYKYHLNTRILEV